MGNPLAERTNPQHPGGNSGVAELVRQFPTEGHRKAYSDWAEHPVTRLVRNALRDMALNGIPGRADNESLAVQYGIVLGLGAAAQMLEDASLIVPGVFTVGSQAVPNIVESFTSSPDKLLDNQ